MGELHGGNGAIAWGKVKFKGESKAKVLAMKGYFRPSEALEKHLHEVVERLRKSKARHPKMCVLPLTVRGHKNLYLGMEPFFRMRNKEAVSKMEQTERVVNQIRIPRGVEKLKQILRETAELAKVGLIVPVSLAVPRDFIALGLPQEALQEIAHKQIDVFNQVKLQNGKTQIISQDIDELKIASNPRKAWQQSTQNIMGVVIQQNPGQGVLVKKIINEAQRKHKL